jgi:hypothetical protein
MVDVFRRVFVVDLGPTSRVKEGLEAGKKAFIRRDDCLENSVFGPFSQIFLGNGPSLMSLTSAVERGSEVTYALEDKLTNC